MEFGLGWLQTCFRYYTLQFIWISLLSVNHKYRQVWEIDHWPQTLDLWPFCQINQPFKDRCLAMSQPIKALQFRTKKYAWSLAIVSWLLAIGNSSQAIIYRKSLHYIHNSTFIGKSSIFFLSNWIQYKFCSFDLS